MGRGTGREQAIPIGFGGIDVSVSPWATSWAPCLRFQFILLSRTLFRRWEVVVMLARTVVALQGPSPRPQTRFAGKQPPLKVGIPQIRLACCNGPGALALIHTRARAIVPTSKPALWVPIPADKLQSQGFMPPQQACQLAAASHGAPCAAGGSGRSYCMLLSPALVPRTILLPMPHTPAPYFPLLCFSSWAPTLLPVPPRLGLPETFSPTHARSKCTLATSHPSGSSTHASLPACAARHCAGHLPGPPRAAG